MNLSETTGPLVEALKKLVITEKYFFLFTKIQFAVTFKEDMDQRQIDAFVPYIKMHCPGIKVI